MIAALIEFELRKLGLREKEVKVYLAGLELGPSSVKKIAEIAKITRPTTYEILKNLEKKGLFIETKEKKKRVFIAQSPEKILGILKVQKREIEEKEREFIRIISALRAKYYSADQSEIRTFEGKEGLGVLLDDFSQSRTEKIFMMSNNPGSLKPWRERLPEIKRRLGVLQIKEIKNKKGFKGTLIVYDKIIYLSFSDKSAALVIEKRDIVELLKILLQ